MALSKQNVVFIATLSTKTINLSIKVQEFLKCWFIYKKEQRNFESFSKAFQATDTEDLQQLFGNWLQKFTNEMIQVTPVKKWQKAKE